MNDDDAEFMYPVDHKWRPTTKGHHEEIINQLTPFLFDERFVIVTYLDSSESNSWNFISFSSSERGSFDRYVSDMKINSIQKKIIQSVVTRKEIEDIKTNWTSQIFFFIVPNPRSYLIPHCIFTYFIPKIYLGCGLEEEDSDTDSD